MDAKNAADRISELLAKGENLTQIIEKHPELIVGLDEYHKRMLKAHIQASCSSVIKRTKRHKIKMK